MELNHYRSCLVKPEFLHIYVLGRSPSFAATQLRHRLILWGRHRFKLRNFQIPEPQAQGFYQNGMHRTTKIQATQNLVRPKNYSNFIHLKNPMYELWGLACQFQLLLFPFANPNLGSFQESKIELLLVQISDLFNQSNRIKGSENQFFPGSNNPIAKIKQAIGIYAYNYRYIQRKRRDER